LVVLAAKTTKHLLTNKVSQMSETNTNNLSFDGMGNPGDPTGVTVPTPVAKTAPLPSTKASETRYYFCPTPNASMYRSDGFRLIFIGGVHATDLKASQDYLEREIEDGNVYVRRATDVEVHNHKMKVDPKGTIRDQVLAEEEVRIREQLEREILTNLKDQGIISDEQKLKYTTDPELLMKRMAESARSGKATVFAPIPEQSEANKNSFQRSTVGSNKGAV
jgi:hypothetical protein